MDIEQRYNRVRAALRRNGKRNQLKELRLAREAALNPDASSLLTKKLGRLLAYWEARHGLGTSSAMHDRAAAVLSEVARLDDCHPMDTEMVLEKAKELADSLAVMLQERLDDIEMARRSERIQAGLHQAQLRAEARASKAENRFRRVKRRHEQDQATDAELAEARAQFDAVQRAS